MVDQILQVHGQPSNMIPRFRLTGAAMTAQIWRDDEVRLGKSWDVALEDCARSGEAVKLSVSGVSRVLNITLARTHENQRR